MCLSCIIWGAGDYGKRISQLAENEMQYKIIAFCDKNLEIIGKKIGKHEIISIEQAISLCRNEKITIIIGVYDFAAVENIRLIIKNSFPADVNVVVGHDIQNEAENKMIREYHQNMVFRWKIDFEKSFQIWIDNIMSEVEYWVNEVADTRGRNHAYNTECRRNNKFIHQYILPEIKGGEVIMDIGCGLVSRYGTQLKNGDAVKLIPVDALAHFYNYINGRMTDGLKQGYFCCFGLFEFLGHIFGKGYADYIIINNALDHCIDPWKSIVESLYILKQGGHMHLNHRRAEAVYENWAGLHKWNIDCVNGELLIWNKENAVNVTEKLREYADIDVNYDAKEKVRIRQMLHVDIVKKRELELEDFFDIEEEANVLVRCVDELMKKLALDSKMFFRMLEHI